MRMDHRHVVNHVASPCREVGRLTRELAKRLALIVHRLLIAHELDSPTELVHVDWTLSLRGLLVEWRHIHRGDILGELDTPIAGHWWGLRIDSTLLLDTSMERCGANSLLLTVMLLRVLGLCLWYRLL